MIPLPLLDSHTTPHSIALPFRKHPLRSLQSRSAIFILERYYSNAVKCIYSQSNTPEDLQMFNSRIYSWVVSNVSWRVMLYFLFFHDVFGNVSAGIPTSKRGKMVSCIWWRFENCRVDQNERDGSLRFDFSLANKEREILIPRRRCH